MREQTPGRPRSRQADLAILDAALQELIERGIGAVSIEQVANRAGVTRATVYRRFPDKTKLVIAALQAAYSDPPQTPAIDDVETMLSGWAGVLADPRQRRLLRRLYAAVEDDAELAAAYHELFGRGRDQARQQALARARDDGQFPADADPAVLLDVLTGAVWQHLASRPDSSTQAEVEQFLHAVLTELGYRPDSTNRATALLGHRPSKSHKARKN